MIYELVMEWAQYRDFILPSLAHSHGSHTEDDIIAGLFKGDGEAGFKLWKGAGAAMLTHFIQFPQFKILNAWLGGGDLDELMRMKPLVEAYARQNGCKQVRGGGRFGWERVLSDYDKIGVVMCKEL